MKKTRQQTTAGINALLWLEDDLFVAKAIEVEVASQGKTEAEALKNLEEAVELYFENEPKQLKTSAFLKLQLHTIFPKIRYA